MKRSFIDKLIGFVSPAYQLKRIRNKAVLEFYERSYDAAQTFQTDDWSSVNSNGANSENKKALDVIRNKSRDAIRNNPYALRGKKVIVSNTIGHGIVPNIKSKIPNDNEKITLIKDAWKVWGETALCDAEGRKNFYELQALAMGSIVESGEVFTQKLITKDAFNVLSDKGLKEYKGAIKIQVIESDFLDTQKEDKKTVQGIELDPLGKRTGYYFFLKHPGEGEKSESKKIPSELVSHVYFQERPGQQRGVSWFHSVIRALEDFKNYQEATLIRQKIAACYAVFITSKEDSNLPVSVREAKYQSDSMLEPGLIKRLNEGEDIKFASPPGADGYAEYCRQTLRSISAGLGITYESFTNDYSQVNFSSGRMGHIEMNRNIEMWRWNMFIPQFCEPSFKWFLEWCQLVLGLDTNGIYAEWTPPARVMIDPSTETEAIKKQIRAGIKTLPEAIREQGLDPEEFFLEVQKSNQLMDKYGLAFDSDARKMSSVGFAQAGDSFDKLLGLDPGVNNSDSKTNN